MKLLVAAIFAFLAASAFAEDDWDNIDWSKVVPVTEMPGFWDGRDIPHAAFDPENMAPERRIVGGAIVTPGAHPYQAGASS